MRNIKRTRIDTFDIIILVVNIMIIDKLNQLHSLTNQEQAVVDYINDHPKAVINDNVNQLAKNSLTSASTIIRLCKKLDLSGYTEFKLLYTSQYPEMMKQQENLKTQPFQKDTSFDEILDILPLAYTKAIDYIKTMLSKNTMIRVINKMKQAKRIEIYGQGINYDLGRMIAYQFESVNKDCFVYNAPHWEHIQHIELHKIPTLAILLSHTGKNPIIVDAAKRLKKSHIHTISLTCNCEEKLARLTDEHIEIIDFKSELELKTMMYTMGVQYVLGVCISSLMIHNIDQIQSMTHQMKGEREKWME